MTGKELMEWLAEQPAEVLALPVEVVNDTCEYRYRVRWIEPRHGVLYVIDSRLMPRANDEEVEAPEDQAQQPGEADEDPASPW